MNNADQAGEVSGNRVSEETDNSPPEKEKMNGQTTQVIQRFLADSEGYMRGYN